MAAGKSAFRLSQTNNQTNSGESRMSNQLATATHENQMNVVSTQTQQFELMQRKAKALSLSTLVPKAYQGNQSNCIIALNMAEQLGANELMVMQNLYIVHGNPGWSAKFLIATFNMSKDYGSLSYEFKGEEGSDDWGCRAKALEVASNTILPGPWVTIKMAKAEGWHQKSGSKWQTMPEMMLRYRAATFFIRTTAPEISMGLQTEDELHDVLDAAPDNKGVFRTQNDVLDAFGAGKVGNDAGVEEPAAPFEDVEIIQEPDGTPINAETGEVVEAAPANLSGLLKNWETFEGGEPIQGGDIFEGIDAQMRAAEAVGSQDGLRRVFATQREAIAAMDAKSQTLLFGAYRRKDQELSHTS
jgi:hypothetical protein